MFCMAVGAGPTKEFYMTAEELYNKILADGALQAEFEAATDSGKVADFLSAKGCSASADEFAVYVADHA